MRPSAHKLRHNSPQPSGSVSEAIRSPARSYRLNSLSPSGSVPGRFGHQLAGSAGEASMPSTHSPLRCVDRLASGYIIEPRRAEAFPRRSVCQLAVTASMRCRRAEAVQDDPLAMQGDSLWGADGSCAESGMVTKSTPANKSACDCTIANPSHDERSPYSTRSRCGDGDAPPAQERQGSARRGM
jgi:hypothetical protein